MNIKFKNRLSGTGWPHVLAMPLFVRSPGGTAHAQTRGDVNAGAIAIATPTPTPDPTGTPPSCARTIKADVVALDQVITFNRLGAMNPGGMMFALRNDLKPIDSASGMVAGNVTLKEYKRPRPLVLRMNVGDCLQILFQNLLSDP